MRKGQLSVDNIVALFVIITVFAVIVPSLGEIINIGIGYGDTLDTILNLIMPLMAISIISAIFLYARPYYQRQE